MKLSALRGQRDRARVVEDNLVVLHVPALSRRNVLQSEARGQVVVTKDGTLALLVDDIVLGLPFPDEDLDHAVAGVDSATVVVLFGAGVGQTVRQLRRVIDNPIIVVEPDPGQLRCLLEHGPTDLGDVCLVSEMSDLAGTWSTFGKKLGRALLIGSPGYRERYPDQAKEVAHAVKRFTERVAISRTTMDIRARTWVSDILTNLELLKSRPPLLAARGSFKNVPAFIVGAGPSLDRNIALLDKAREKGLVFAVNSSVPALAKRGIIPHAVVCLESIDISARLAAVPFMNEVLRVMSLTAHPNTLRANRGPLTLFHERVSHYDAPLQELTGAPGVSVSGSVCTAAFSIALELGCSPIVLVGQDMAYPEGRTYAEGTGYEASTARINEDGTALIFDWSDGIKAAHGLQHGPRHSCEPMLHVAAWGARGTVPTGSSLMALSEWLRDTVKQHDLHDRRFVNATEGGARVDGFEELTLQALLETLPDVRVSGDELYATACARRKPIAQEQLLAWALEQSRLSGEVEDRALVLRRLGEQALSSVDSGNPSSVTRAFADLDEAQRRVRLAVRRSPFVDAFSHSSVGNLVRQHRKQATSGDEHNAVFGLRLGTQVAEAIEQSARELRDAFQILANELGKDANNTKGNSLCL